MKARPGVRFTCHGDGLCCTDIHLPGPLTRPEVQTLRLISDEVVYWNKEIEGYVLLTGTDGACIFWNDGCRLHQALGPQGKPAGCRRYPWGLTATPTGGRITTEHRCPCRSLPDGEPVDVEEAAQWLANAGGRLEPSRRVEGRVRLTRRRHLAFTTWERVEAELLEALDGSTPPESVLDEAPFPALPQGGWNVVADALCADPPTTRYSAATGWFGDAIASIHGETVPFDRPRLWAPSFDRAMARMPPPRTVDAVLADYVADEIWMMAWAPFGWDVGRKELATRLRVARELISVLSEQGVDPVRAAAETVMILALSGVSDAWLSACEALKSQSR